MTLSQLKGLGPKSEKWLNEIGIFTKADLEKIGVVKTYIKLQKGCSTKPSMNFLYAMVGALENEHWAKIAKSERERLLMEIEGNRELEKMLKNEGIVE